MRKFSFSFLSLVFSFANSLLFGGHDHQEKGPDTLSDAALRELANSEKEFDSVVALEKPISFCGYLYPIASGSSVHIGDGIFLTNAHCIEPWLSPNKTELKYILTIRSKNKRFVIKKIFLHPNTFLKGEINPFYDIAILYCPKVKNQIPHISPDYLITLDGDKAFLEKSKFIGVGFGVDGDNNAWFRRCDGNKRAVYLIKPDIGFVDGYEKLCILSSLLGARYKYEGENKVILEKRTKKAYEGGVRHGMSGGGFFEKTKDGKIKLIGLTGGSSSSGPFPTLKMLISNKAKYLAALGIPTPGLDCCCDGQSQCCLVLSCYQEFIEDVKNLRHLPRANSSVERKKTR